MEPAWLYDGTSAVRREVEVEASGEALLIRFPGGESETVPPGRLCHIESRASAEVYGRTDIQGWRLGISAQAKAALAAALPAPQRYGRLIDRIGLVPAIAAFILVSGTVIFAGGKLPEWLAPHVPMSWEKKYADSVVGDFGGRYCNGPGGQAALDKLARRLSPSAARYDIKVVDIDMVNAAALPGGTIILFEELLAESDGPDEVAGVLAHEISHVERRHVTESMLRDLGLGVVISAFGGGAGGSIDSVLSAGHSRASEREADRDSVDMLRRAGISPLPTAGFFERLAKQEEKLGRVGEGLSYLSTHPMSSERRELFRSSAQKGRAYAPALSRDEWEALFNICFNDPKRRGG